MQSIFSPLIKIYKALYLLAYDITGNYGISLILLSFFTFVVLYPFNKKAQQIQNKEHKIQAVLAPQIEELKKRYKGQEQYENLQWLYHRYGYHPVYAIRSALGFIFQIPFLTAAYYMLSGLAEIRGVSWGIIPDLGAPDHLLGGINLLPFVMTMVTVVYAFVMPKISRKERMQTVGIGVFFLVLLYSAPSALLIFWTCNLLWSLLDSVLSEKLRWTGEYLEKNEASLYVIFALALTICVFVPAEIYINNAEQLWFGFADILKYFLKYIITYSLILFLIFVILPHKNFKYAYLSLLLGILLGVFLQSYVIGLNYGTFDGHEIRWKDYTVKGLVNTLIWLVCIGGSVIVFYRMKFDKNKIRKIVKQVSIGLIFIQCAVLFFIWTKNPTTEKHVGKQDTVSVLTTKDMYHISSKQNVIIFLLDAFDASIFEEMMVKEPEIIKKLKDFTFYPDTTSVYGFTSYSLPQMFTGEAYRGDVPFNEYFEEAWANVPYYKLLEKNNYNIGIYTDGIYVHPQTHILNLESDKVVFNEESIKSFRNLVLFRVSPHFLKKRFYKYNPNEWISMLQNQKIPVYREDDKQFYTGLKKGLTFDDKKNCFRFYHLAGAHGPYVIDRNVESVNKESGSQYEQSVGALKIVLEYIDQMKQNGVFNNATFVITADHGAHNSVGSRPLLCIKYSDDYNKVMKVSDESVSFSRFMPMVLQKFENKEIKRDLSDSDRIFYYVDKKKIIEYKIVGNAKEIDSWKKGKTMYAKSDSLYTLGTKVATNTRNKENERFLLKGWDRVEDHAVWSLGPDSEVQFKIKDYKKQDLQFQFCATTVLVDIPYRTVTVYANNKFITKLIFDNKNPVYSFKIPSSVISDDMVNVHFSIDHSGVHKEKLADGRDLGIFLQWMKIDAVQ